MTRNASQIATLRAKYADNEALYGLPGDRRRNRHDQKELGEILNNANVKWCLAGIPALKFWGVPKIALDYDLCVSPDQMELATGALISSGLFTPFRPTRLRGEEPFAPYPRFKRVGVHLFVRLIPSSFFDLDVERDCLSATHRDSRLTLHAPYPQCLIHALLFAKNHHKYARGLADVEYLLLHNADDLEWGDGLVCALEDELEIKQLTKAMATRAHQRNSAEGVLRGKWDDVTEAERYERKFSF